MILDLNRMKVPIFIAFDLQKNSCFNPIQLTSNILTEKNPWENYSKIGNLKQSICFAIILFRGLWKLIQPKHSSMQAAPRRAVRQGTNGKMSRGGQDGAATIPDIHWLCAV